jgi:predicted phosphoribosyltransferase
MRKLIEDTGLRNKVYVFRNRAHAGRLLAMRLGDYASSRHGRPFPELNDKTIILVDDGLASGYTMSEAIRFVKRKFAKKIIAAIPTASESSIELILPLVDELYCLNIRGYPYAAADAYKEWHDVSDEEVMYYLKKASDKKS